MRYVGGVDKSKESGLASFFTRNGLTQGEVDFSPNPGVEGSSRRCVAFSKPAGEVLMPISVMYLGRLYVLDNANARDMCLVRDSFDKYGAPIQMQVLARVLKGRESGLISHFNNNGFKLEPTKKCMSFTEAGKIKYLIYRGKVYGDPHASLEFPADCARKYGLRSARKTVQS